VQPGILAEGTGLASDAAVVVAPEEEVLELKLGDSVGRWEKGAVNAKEDVETIQEMLRHASMILNEPRLDPSGIDGKINSNSSKSGTVQAIELFQSRFLTRPDGVISVGGRTWRELLHIVQAGEIDTASSGSSGTSNFFFPFTRLPSTNWTAGMGRFGGNRGNGRAHAACDLYFPAGTIIHAITDGTVTRGPSYFYNQTYALEIDHGSFIARYGEIQQSTFVREGDRVRAGQPIAKVGHLVGLKVPSDMLHLELYDKTASGPLSVPAAAGKKAPNGRPFMRRKDLIDPTPKLNEWKNNLPKDD
jgi:murein DD-endopeptidase MepM/ murein hydrolase activator NlpD